MNKSLFLALMAVAAIALTGCEKKSDSTPGGTSKKVETISATDITSFSALLTGQVGVEIADYKSIEFGMLISQKESDVSSHEGKKLTGDKLLGQTFSVTAQNLSAETKYYYRAYLVLNAMQYEYGEVKSFKTEPGQGSGMERGHEWIDLGLPSGIKWATCNVGASKPEEYGDYFAWGETSPKTTYDWNTYFDTNDGGSTFTKYNNNGGKTVLDLTDDAAHVNWGGNWRMPTKAEQNELVEECTWTWTTLNNINGYKVEGTNGNSFFLPASGHRNGSSLGFVGYYGWCWSSSLYENYSVYAYYLEFASNSVGRNGSLRLFGFSVRPVLE